MSAVATTTLAHGVKTPLFAALCSQCLSSGQRNINTFSKNSAKQLTQSCKISQSCKLVKSTMDANMCKICGCLANPRKYTSGFDPKMNSAIRFVYVYLFCITTQDHIDLLFMNVKDLVKHFLVYSRKRTPLYFSVSDREYFIYTFPKTEQYICL